MSKKAKPQDPFVVLSDAQFGALFKQAAGPLVIQAQMCQQAINALVNGDMVPAQVNPVVGQFEMLYEELDPYFEELDRRAQLETVTPLQESPVTDSDDQPYDEEEPHG